MYFAHREIPDLLYRALCNSLISLALGAQIRVLQVFANHMLKKKCQTNALTIVPHHAEFYVFIFKLRLWVTYAPDEPVIF